MTALAAASCAPQPWLSNGPSLIREQANRGPLDSARLTRTLKALARIAKECKTLGCEYRAENLFTFLQRDPALVGKGAFKDSF